MSLHPTAVEPVPEQTGRIARAAFPKGNLYMTMQDEFATFFTDEEFADLFPRRGQPAEAPWRLALVTLFQFVENLSDRQAADAVRARIDWKYALSLELDDPGFDSSVLCEFRARLLETGAENRLFEIILARFKDRGLLKVRGRQRTDSTHILAAVRGLHRLETIAETLRHALNCLAELAPEWLVKQAAPEWYDRYAARQDALRLPRQQAERETLAVTMGEDGSVLLAALWSPDTPEALRALPAVATLRLVWIQQFVRQDGQVRLRDEKEMPPGAQMIRSPYDPQARLSVKRETQWTGYKVHLAETCDAGQPRLITQVETTSSTTADSSVTSDIQAKLAQAERLPAEHLVDEGYTQASHLISSQSRYQIRLIGPVARDGSRQAVAAEGFDIRHFQVDWQRQCALCPGGKTSAVFRPTRNARGSLFLLAVFAKSDCQACPYRAQCTRSQSRGRTLYLHPQAEHEALHQARAYQQTRAFQEAYRVRAGIEGTLSQGVRVGGMRRSRYVGLAKTHLQNLTIGAALNFCRVFDWLQERPLAKTRQSHFARLSPALAKAA